MTQPLSDETLPEELERKDRELRLIAEVSALIGRAAPLRSILDRIAARVAELLNTPYAAILLLTLDGRQVTIEGAFGLAAPYIAAVNRRGLPRDDVATLPSLEVCRTGRPQIWNNMPADPRVAFLHEAQRTQGISAMIVVPLVGPDGPIGTLNCYHPQPGHFGAHEIQLLTRFGAHAAQAIHNAHLVERLNASVRRLSQMNDLVQRQNHILARSEAIHRQLSALVLEEQGLGAIVATLAGLLGCGVRLYDADLALLDAAEPAPPGGPPAPLLAPQLLGPGSPLGAGRQSLVSLAAGPGVSAPALVCPIAARGKTLGFLAVPATAVSEGELERRALEHAATVCAVELLKQRVGQEMAWRQRAAFLDDLLAGRLGEPDEIRRRAQALGSGLDGRYRLALVAPDQLAAYVEGRQLAGQQVVDLKQQLAEVVARAAQQASPQSIVLPRGEQLGVLLPCPPGAGAGCAALAAAIIAAVGGQLPGLSASVGLSGEAGGAAALARAYHEAEEALAVVRNLGGSGAALGYDELGVYSLILRGSARADLLRLAHRWLDGLAAYERRRGVDLIATLEQYLAQGCNPQRVAEALFVHPNTVKHRLRLVREQTGLALDDTRQLLELQLALLVRRLHPAEFAGQGPGGDGAP